MIIGCALSAAGSAYQGLFRNPMVAPDILGASGGAGLGAAIGLFLSLNAAEVQLLSFFIWPRSGIGSYRHQFIC
ncbi:iron ABC transporter, permease protein [Sporolactobacillus inulinus]|uniref:Iron ABC transporter, permease protein n=2 Tax=Sporolactobacillus inulinus TaxID=2078 RepID=A0A4Y1Z9I3_9BACL|nr:iron ABC transporter, permease protein [Sporolactobacillus inulinus]